MNELGRFLDGDASQAPARARILAGMGIGSGFLVFVPVIAALWWMAGAEYVDQRGTRLAEAAFR